MVLQNESQALITDQKPENHNVVPIRKPPVHHAHLLTDSKGPYGIFVDYPPDAPNNYLRHCSQRVVVRADRIEPDTSLPTLFQFLPHGRQPWARGYESILRDQLHEMMLIDRGIEPRENPDAEYWRKWHGLRRSATRTINSLLAQVYENVPDDLLRVVRRFPLVYRSDVYGGLCVAGNRAWQLADSFPVLAWLIYDARKSGERSAEARNMVNRGARLRDIAAAVRMPMEFQRFKPMVIRWLLIADKDALLRRFPYLVAHHCPDTVPKQRAWLRAIRNAGQSHDEDYQKWVATHFEKIGSWREVPAIVGDVGDWVRAANESKATVQIDPIELERIQTALQISGASGIAGAIQSWWDNTNKDFAGRPFHTNMAARTALKLSEEWHDRMAKTKAANLPFPEPWYDGDTINGYRIEPVKAADELSRHAYQLHNCAITYAPQIAEGGCFLYVISNGDGKPLAMAELIRGETPKLQQLKGACNKAVPKPIQRATRTWLSRQKRKNGAGRMPPPVTEPGFGEIPF